LAAAGSAQKFHPGNHGSPSTQRRAARVSPALSLMNASQRDSEPVTPKRLFHESQTLGKGSYGSVHPCVNKTTGQIYVAKFVKQGPDQSLEEVEKAVVKEVELMKKAEACPWVINVLGMHQNRRGFVIYMEHASGGTLADYYRKYFEGNGIPEAIIRKFIFQVLTGVEWLHSKDILHLDIKGANVLLDHQENIKLADFGCGMYVDEAAEGDSRGSLPWMDPERALRQPATTKCDVWAIGCLPVELAIANQPWATHKAGQSPQALVYHLRTAREGPPVPEHLSAEAQDLIQCCHQNPKLRPQCEDLLTHRWFSEDWSPPADDDESRPLPFDRSAFDISESAISPRHCMSSGWTEGSPGPAAAAPGLDNSLLTVSDLSATTRASAYPTTCAVDTTPMDTEATPDQTQKVEESGPFAGVVVPPFFETTGPVRDERDVVSLSELGLGFNDLSLGGVDVDPPQPGKAGKKQKRGLIAWLCGSTK